MVFSGLELCKRLERAEGNACAGFADARRRLFPGSGAGWMECAGAYAVFDGIDSPVTQTFGLGIFEELNTATLDAIERFFLDRGANVCHEVSPFAGAAAMDLLCGRHYRPVEMSSVLYRPVEKPSVKDNGRIGVRVAGPEEAPLWAEISAKGWSHEHPEFLNFLLQLGGISAVRERSPCFLGEIDGKPGAAGGLSIHEGIALFAGAATLPEMRRRGLQTALMEERMRYAFEHGCDLAMMASEVGSGSQRNAERDFRAGQYEIRICIAARHTRRHKAGGTLGVPRHAAPDGGLGWSDRWRLNPNVRLQFHGLVLPDEALTAGKFWRRGGDSNPR